MVGCKSNASSSAGSANHKARIAYSHIFNYFFFDFFYFGSLTLNCPLLNNTTLKKVNQIKKTSAAKGPQNRTDAS